MTEALRNKLIELARISPFKEICGFVDSEENVYPVVNVSTFQHRFIFSKAGYFRALEMIRAKGTKVVAIYHSHVDGSDELSDTDIETMRRFQSDFILISGSEVKWVRYE